MHKSPPIFIINLKKDSEKFFHMQAVCKRYDLKVDFIEAVDGKVLGDEEILKVSSPVASMKEIGRQLARGEIGCALSHKKIYQKMVDENISKALIFEDDIEFDENLLKFLQSNKLPSNAELILLGYWVDGIKNLNVLTSFRHRTVLSKFFKLVRFTRSVHGTYGYFISYEGAQKLLHALNEKIKMPIDHYTGEDKYVNLYGVYPPLIRLSSLFDIDTELEKERRKKRNEFDTQPMQHKKIKQFLERFRLLGIMKGLWSLYARLVLFYHQIKKQREYQ